MRIATVLAGALTLCIVAFPVAAENGAVIRADELKAMPFIDAASSAKVAANQPVTIVSRKGGWLEVQVNGQTGWLRMLNVRLAGGSRPAQDQANLRAASLLRTNSSGKTITTGIKGLGEEDLRNASPDPAQLSRLQAMSVNAEEARANARNNGLVEQQVDFLDSKSKGKARKK
jgi:hypothetical protein